LGLKPFLHHFFHFTTFTKHATSSVMILWFSQIHWQICYLIPTSDNWWPPTHLQQHSSTPAWNFPLVPSYCILDCHYCIKPTCFHTFWSQILDHRLLFLGVFYQWAVMLNMPLYYH
jgi:hypothetical protein